MKHSFKIKMMAFAVAGVLAGVIGFSGDACAAKGQPGPPAGGGGGPGEDTAAQNLSVPTIMVGGAAGGLANCLATPSELIPPDGEPLDGFTGPADNPLDPTDYYWVQKVHDWQAQCFSDTAAVAFGAWGDNLAGDAKLKVNKPIRVELVLHNETDYSGTIPSLQGYEVIKLQNTLDRLSAYGHLGGIEVDGDGNPILDDEGNPIYFDIPIDFPPSGWLVHDSGITFRVCALDNDGDETDICPVPAGTSPTAEINATGKVVYGYQLYVAATGTYRIVFTTSGAVTVTGQDATTGGLYDEHNVYVDITVGTGGGGGGGGRPQRP
jgi:hypothetical protein